MDSDVSGVACRASKARGGNRGGIREKRRSPAQVEQSQQKNPQAVHKMPVHGTDLYRGLARDFGFVKIAERNVGQRGYATQQMRRVGRGEDVEKAGGLIVGDINATGEQLKPGNHLA